MSREDRKARRKTPEVRPDAESLEGRALLSAGQAAGPPYTFKLPDYAAYSQGSGGIDVTIGRRDRRGTAQVEVTTVIDGVTAGTAVAGVQYQPIDEVVTFGRGERTKTVTIPLNAGAPNPGRLTLGVFLKGEEPGATYQSAVLTLAAQADVSRPRVLGGALIVHGGAAPGIRLAFERPMAAGEVTDLANYAVLGVRSKGLAGWFSSLGTAFATPSLGRSQATTQIGPIALREATYNPDNNTVTLIPYRALKPSGRFEVRGIFLGAHGSPTPPTDLMGNPLSNFDLTIDSHSSIARGHAGARMRQ